MDAGPLRKFPATQHYIPGKLFASQAMTNPLCWVTSFGKKHLLCWIMRWGSDHGSRLWLVGRNQDLAELLLGQTRPLAFGYRHALCPPQWEAAVAFLSWCELQPGLLEDVEWGLEVALALWKLLNLRGCTATVGKGKGHWLMRRTKTPWFLVWAWLHNDKVWLFHPTRSPGTRVKLGMCGAGWWL